MEGRADVLYEEILELVATLDVVDTADVLELEATLEEEDTTGDEYELEVEEV